MLSAEPTPFLTDPSGTEHPLNKEVSTLGRGVDNDIVVASKRVSREHAKIYRSGRKLLLEDLNSTNGTYWNNERISSPTLLRDGDWITIGEVTLQFHDPDTTTRETPFPDLDVDLQAGVVRLERNTVSLSPKEFALLAFLFTNRGRVCSKEEIGEAVWSEYQAGIYDYQIENLVRRLRTKIELDPNAPVLLITMRGLGYRLMG